MENFQSKQSAERRGEEDNCEFMASIEIVTFHAGAMKWWSSKLDRAESWREWRRKSKGAQKRNFRFHFDSYKTVFFFTSSRHSVQGQNMLRAAFI